jgi:integrase
LPALGRGCQSADLKGRIEAPKSEAGRRDIPMIPPVINSLKEWKLACPRRGVEKDADGNVTNPGELYYVFPTRTGTVQSHANIRNRLFDPLMIECGLLRSTVS